MPADLFPENGEAESHDSDGRIGSLEQARLDAERRHIARALEATGGEIGAASKLLGVGRTTLREKMRLGLRHRRLIRKQLRNSLARVRRRLPRRGRPTRL
ncbi:MAG: hypothetical protein MZV49_07225 [Rhodopseudomonas palustris]|nr:hypothetical protein [Rhodopseudomonas palustris]